MRNDRPQLSPRERKARHAKLYAFGAVAVQLAGNGAYLANKLFPSASEATAIEGPGQTAAAAFESLSVVAVVMVCTHLLLSNDEGDRIETSALWAGFGGGAILSAFHMFSVATTVGTDWRIAMLLPLAVEGGAIGSIRQYVRFSKAVPATKPKTPATRVGTKHDDGSAATTSTKPTGKVGTPERDYEALVAGHLANEPGASCRVIAVATGVSKTTVGKTEAWKNRPTTSTSTRTNGANR